MMGVPTSTVSPSAWCSSETTPAYGDGISTAAFAVSTSTIGWLSFTSSPGPTNHLRISPSVRPSPRSGRLNCFMRDIASGLLEREGAVDGIEYPVQVGQVLLLQPSRRVRGVEAGDPEHGRFEVVEAPFGDAGGELRPETEVARRLVDDHQPAGLLHRRVDGLQVERRERAQVDDLDTALPLGGERRVERRLHHGPVRDD